MFKVERHLWRTQDGRLVEHGHPDAAALAYAAGTELPDALAERAGLIQKAMPKPQDKAMSAPQNKGVTVVDPELVALRTQATDLGVRVDGRWSADRLRQEIDTKTRESQ